MSDKIYLLERDKINLLKLIETAKYIEYKQNKYINALEAEIDRAVITDEVHLPADVVTMHSKILLSVDGIDEEITLVYPDEADIKRDRISVLSPMGTAILGYSEGSIIKWQIPSGTALIEIKKVLCRQEALRIP